MIRYLTLWMKSMKLALEEDMAYKFNFMIHVLSQIVFGLLAPLFALLIYSNSSGFPGWTFWQFILMTGAGTLVWGLLDCGTIAIIYRVSTNVQEGSFDRILVRPYHPLLYLSASTVDLDGIPKALVGLILVILAMYKVGFTLAGFAMFLTVIALALIAVYSFVIIVAALAFIVVKSFGIWSIIETFEEYKQFPITVYGSILGAVFTFVLPVGLAAFYPASALLGKLDWSMIGYLAIYAFAFFTAGLLFWSYAMKKYSSAGG